MPPSCSVCGKSAILKRPKTGKALCKECFFVAFEDEVHRTIKEGQLFKPDEVLAVAASGGKDSTVLAHVLKLLNERHNYGVKLILLSIDEGITGYRDGCLEVGEDFNYISVMNLRRRARDVPDFIVSVDKSCAL